MYCERRSNILDQIDRCEIDDTQLHQILKHAKVIGELVEKLERELVANQDKMMAVIQDKYPVLYELQRSPQLYDIYPGPARYFYTSLELAKSHYKIKEEYLGCGRYLLFKIVEVKSSDISPSCGHSFDAKPCSSFYNEW